MAQADQLIRWPLLTAACQQLVREKPVDMYDELVVGDLVLLAVDIASNGKVTGYGNVRYQLTGGQSLCYSGAWTDQGFHCLTGVSWPSHTYARNDPTQPGRLVWAGHNLIAEADATGIIANMGAIVLTLPLFPTDVGQLAIPFIDLTVNLNQVPRGLKALQALLPSDGSFGFRVAGHDWNLTIDQQKQVKVGSVTAYRLAVVTDFWAAITSMTSDQVRTGLEQLAPLTAEQFLTSEAAVVNLLPASAKQAVDPAVQMVDQLLDDVQDKALAKRCRLSTS